MHRYTTLWNINVRKQQQPETCTVINDISIYNGYSLIAKGHPYHDISSPDVNMNYIRSLLFLDVCIEIVTVEQSAFALFAFMCVYLYVSSCLYFTMCIFFSRMSDYCHVQFVACTFVTCCNKDQSINKSYHKVMWQRDLWMVRSFTNTLLQIYC